MYMYKKLVKHFLYLRTNEFAALRSTAAQPPRSLHGQQPASPCSLAVNQVPAYPQVAVSEGLGCHWSEQHASSMRR